MDRQRPTTVLVMAIFNIMFGALCSLCNLVGAAEPIVDQANRVPRVPGSPPPNRASEAMYDYVPGIFAVKVGLGCSNLVLNLLLIVSGIGLLLMKPWGRWLGIGASATIIVIALLYALYVVVIGIPGLERWRTELAAHPAGTRYPGGVIIGGVMGGALLACGMLSIYPVVSLMVLLLPSVAAAFNAPPESPGGGGYGMPPIGPSGPQLAPRRF